MSNPKHVEIVRQGKEAIDVWRTAHPGTHLNLGGANLTGADLNEADLRGVIK